MTNYLNEIVLKLKYNRGFLTNSFWIAFQNGFCAILTLVVTFFASRYYGPDNWGVLNYADSWVSIFSVVASFGINSILVNEFSKNTESPEKLLGSALCIRTVLSVLVIMILVAEIVITGNITSKKIVLICQSISLLFQGYLVINEWYIIRSMSKYNTFSVILGTIFSFMWKMAAVFMKQSIIVFSFGVVIEAAFAFLSCILIWKKNHFYKLKISINTIQLLLKKSYFFVVGDLAIAIYTEIDKIIINKCMTDYDVGIYSAALNIANIWIFIPTALYYSYRPSILTAWKEKKEEGIKKLKKLIGQLMGVCLLFIIAIGIFRKIIIYVIYGKEYSEAANLIYVLLIAMSLTVFGMLGTIWILAEDIMKYSMYRCVIGAVVNIVLDYIMIKQFGAIGAAWATLISYFIITFVCMLIWKPTRSFITMWKERTV